MHATNWRFKQAGDQAGFTLVEIAIALGIIAALMAIMGPQISFTTRHMQKTETENRLAAVKDALETAYRENAKTVDDNSGNVLALGSSTLVNGWATAAMFQQVASYAGKSAAELALDGFRQPFRVFVSNQLSKPWNGVNVRYHVVAIVSMGADADSAARRTLSPGTTFNPNTGALILGGDDKGIVVDGYAIQVDLAKKSYDKLQKIADLYANYFQTQYLASIDRDIAVDYFAKDGANARWDQTSGIFATSGGTVLAANLAGTLGLALADYTDAYGQVIQVDNASAQVRNPNNPDGNMNLPPYTAAVYTTLPGGDVLRVSVSGAY